MEDFSKSQLILLGLLLCFVTSIATSVAVVSLVSDNGGVPQTIYKVVERTIEKVAEPDNPIRKIVEKETPKQPTVLAPADIADRVNPSLVRIYRKVEGGANKFVALGVVVGSKNYILASVMNVEHDSSAAYIAVTNDGKELNISYDKGSIAGSFNTFVISYDSKEKSKLTSVNLSGFSGIKLGANIIALGGKESGNVVSTGIVSEIRSQGGESSSKDIAITDLKPTSNISSWIIFDSSGNLSGFYYGIDEEDKTALYINASVIKQIISSSL